MSSLTLLHFISRIVLTVHVSYIVPSTETHFFSEVGGGAYYKFWSLGGALIRSGVLIWSWGLIRAFTVLVFQLVMQNFAGIIIFIKIRIICYVYLLTMLLLSTPISQACLDILVIDPMTTEI